MTQVTTCLWEIGVVGLLTYLMLYAFVLHDARMLSRLDGEAGLLGQIWATVAVIMVFGLVYKSVFSMTEIGYLFWFYTGVVAGRAVEERTAQRASARRKQSRLRHGGPARDGGYGGLAEARP
jgi:O-antigen ligase